MEICKEMIKLRKGLDERGIEWIDASDTYENDNFEIDITTYRTQFTANGIWFSVVYKQGTYILYAVKTVEECQTADEILEVIDGLKN